MTKEEELAFDLALKALENSVDLVREDAYNAEKLYGNYPSRQGKVAGLKVLADDHEKAITAIRQVRSAPVQEPESFEQWNAKQHGDPEEIGFLQALRIAYCSGQDSVMKATPPAPQPVPVKTYHDGKPWPVAPKPWVGLTDEDKLTVRRMPWETLGDLMDNTEAKLKEKNHG